VTDLHPNERVRSVIEGPLSAQGYEVVDVEHQGGVLRVTVDRPGGVDLEAVTAATRVVNDVLDLVEETTTLEVSSPGVERSLRTPEHFRRSVGSEVAVKARPGAGGERRLSGVLEAADEDGIVVAGRRLAYSDIERARTVFVWPPKPQKAQSKSSGSKRIGQAS
jgi:ribosome maturation factor RimP